MTEVGDKIKELHDYCQKIDGVVADKVGFELFETMQTTVNGLSSQKAVDGLRAKLDEKPDRSEFTAMQTSIDVLKSQVEGNLKRVMEAEIKTKDA